MTNLDLQYAFELETNSIDSYLTTKLQSDDILYWLNTALDKFIKTRFDGNNITKKSFEQNEKRARDLIFLVKDKLYDLSDYKKYKSGTSMFDVYTLDYPKDLMFVLDETSELSVVEDTSDKTWFSDVFECTLDNYMSRITNKLTDFHLRSNYARPIRIRTRTGCKLFTDKNYNIKGYSIKYIKTPDKISLEDPFKEYIDLPEFALKEIVKMAVQMYIASLGDTKYNEISIENSTME